MPKESTQFKPKPNSFSRVPLSAYVEKPIDAVVRALPNRSEWLRRVITDAAQRELMGNDQVLDNDPVAAMASAHESPGAQPAIADKSTRKQKGGDE